MALKSVDGRYLKVIRELTEFRATGVTVYYYEFASEKDRDEYFCRKENVRTFVDACAKRRSDLEVVIAEEMAKLTHDIKSLEDVPAHVRKMMEESDQLVVDANVVESSWDKPYPMPKLECKKLLKECGFREEWKLPLSAWSINAVNTGAFTNQNFTYECVYRELKKVFRDDFVDC